MSQYSGSCQHPHNTETVTEMSSSLLPALRYSRTVDRELVHKTAVNEVLVTDSVEHRGHYYVAAQLPVSHAYYNDTADGGLNVLAVVEACRQAETLVAHRYLGVEFGTKFLLHKWEYDLVRDACHDVSGAPMSLVIDVRVTDRCDRGGRLRRATVRTEVLALTDEACTRVGDLSLDVSYVPPEAYAAVRAGSAAAIVSSAELMTPPTLVSCADVGCSTDRNVVLDAPVRTQRGMHAQLRPPTDNASMFDHVQDHVPAMLIMEAARQALALCTDEPTASPERASARFGAYTELSEPAVVEYLHNNDAPGRRTVTVRQAGKITAEILLGDDEASADERRKGSA